MQVVQTNHDPSVQCALSARMSWKAIGFSGHPCMIPAGIQEICHNTKPLKDGSQAIKACPIGRVYPKKDT